jgi:predicted regulator of Ras-like GTPase activity (Roadblock/LC7/MglB family)
MGEMRSVFMFRYLSVDVLGNGAVEMDADLVAGAMARAFGGANAVFARFNFPEEELELMIRGIVEVLLQAGLG